MAILFDLLIVLPHHNGYQCLGRHTPHNILLGRILQRHGGDIRYLVLIPELLKNPRNLINRPREVTLLIQQIQREFNHIRPIEVGLEEVRVDYAMEDREVIEKKLVVGRAIEGGLNEFYLLFK